MKRKHMRISRLKESQDWNFILVDVREPDEFKDGHIPGAVNIPMSNYHIKLPALYPDKNTHFVTYCMTGKRCAAVAAALVRMGYTNVEILEGGFQEWMIQERS